MRSMRRAQCAPIARPEEHRCVAESRQVVVARWHTRRVPDPKPKKGPPPLPPAPPPPPRRDTIPVDPEWLEEAPSAKPRPSAPRPVPPRPAPPRPEKTRKGPPPLPPSHRNRPSKPPKG